MLRNTYREVILIIVKSSVILNVTKFEIKCRPKSNSISCNYFKLTANIVITLFTNPIPYKHTMCIPRWNDMKTTLSTSSQREIHVMCLHGGRYRRSSCCNSSFWVYKSMYKSFALTLLIGICILQSSLLS